jgi:ferric-dicitrate binding protein FerR (iron transport regulator)
VSWRQHEKVLKTLQKLWRRSQLDRDLANLPVYDVQSLEDRLAQNRMSVKLLGGMFAVFAAIALVLGTWGSMP